MKRGSTLFLRAAVLAVGAVVLALCIFALPAVWRAVPGDYPDIGYAFYSILLLMYAAAVPFYVVLFQTLRLLSYVDKNTAFSELSVKALKVIKYCAVAISGLFAASLPFFYTWADKDDAPGLVVIGLVLTVAPFAVGVFAAVLQRLLREAIDIKKENDLTV
jgi:hypothetical protein